MLTLAIFDLGAGFVLGLIVSVIIWFRHLKRWRSQTIDVLAAIAALITIISPLWHDKTLTMTINAVAGMLVFVFFVATRIAVTNRQTFLELLAQIGIVCTIYGIVFILSAQEYDAINARAAVGFANANYTGAVLAFGGVATLFLSVVAQASSLQRAAWAAATLVIALAIYQSGSRASFGGLALGALIMWGWKYLPRVLNLGVLLASIIGFLLALIPDSINIFSRASVALGVFDTFQRGAASAADASGRQEVWRIALDHVGDAWLTGWGPGNYYLDVQSDPTFGAHSWGVEYLLSVGVLGTVFIAAIQLLSYRAARIGQAGMWTTASAVALLPSLVVSTHQWTLWAWVAFALWSRAGVLDAVPAGSLDRVAMAPNHRGLSGSGHP